VRRNLIWNDNGDRVITHTTKVMLKILQDRLQQYIDQEHSDVQAALRKGRETRDPIANISWFIEKAREIQKKTSTNALLTMPKHLPGWITWNCGQFLKRSVYQTNLSDSWEICMQVTKQQLELDMEQWTGSKLGKKYIKAVHCNLAYLTYIQSTSC